MASSRHAEALSAVKPAPDELRIIETDPRTDSRWESFVREHPTGSIYHHPAWFEALRMEYGQKGIFLACENPAGQILAILPLLYTRGLPFGLGGSLAVRRLSSLPRTPIAGPLSTDPRATAAMLRAAVERVAKDNGVQLQIKVQAPELDGIVDGVVRTPWRQSYSLQLPTEVPFRIGNSHTRASIKWAINKATRLGVRPRSAETETDLHTWYRLYLETMRQNVVAPRPYRFFSGLWELLKTRGMMELVLAEQVTATQTRIIAGSIFFAFGRTVSYAFNGSRHADLGLRPNDVIQWFAINQACNNGYRYFDFGEVPNGRDDLAKFKSKWGAEAVPLYRYYYPPLLRSTNQLDSDRESSALVKAVWKRLPLPAVSWLGDRLYYFL